MVNASYSCTTSISPGVAPAIASARAPDSAAAVVVISSICTGELYHVAAAAPSTGTGLCGPSFARSVRVSTIAAAPSVTRQQSFTEIGVLIRRALRQSSMVSGPLAKASGLVLAQPRAATATSARCSRVVPYSCMCRAATSA